MKCYRCGANMVLKKDDRGQLYNCSKTYCKYTRLVKGTVDEFPTSDEEKQKAYEEEVLESSPDYVYWGNEEDWDMH